MKKAYLFLAMFFLSAGYLFSEIQKDKLRMKIEYIDRKTSEKKVEEVYGGSFILFFYPNNPVLKSINSFLFSWISKYPYLSKFYGYLQAKESSKKKVIPFIKKFSVNMDDFEKQEGDFTSFNDFFIRKLKKGARKIATSDAVLPADARYLAYQNIKDCPYFSIKGKTFCIESFLQSNSLAKEYENGSLVLARLCPVDYHRFHFPVDCQSTKPELVNGSLYSVNPIALKRKIGILCENKRYITKLQTKEFGQVLFVEIGATNVGTVTQTHKPGTSANKGDEKGYFSFGGSALAIIFKENTIKLDQDLVDATNQGIEILGQMGTSLGQAT